MSERKLFFPLAVISALSLNIIALFIGNYGLSYPLLLIGASGVIFMILAFFDISKDFILIFTFGLQFAALYGLLAVPGSSFFFDNGFFVLAPLYFFLILITYNVSLFNELLDVKINIDFILLTLFFFFLFVSVFLVNTKDILLTKGIFKLLTFFLIAFFMVEIFPRYVINKKIFLKLAKNLSLVGFFFGVVGIFSLVAPINSFSAKYPGMALSLFVHPNTVPFLYSFTLPCALYLLLFEREKFTFLGQLFLGVNIFIMTIGVLFSFSRAGMLGLFVIFSMMIFFYNKKLFFVFLAIVFVSISFLLYVFIYAKGFGTFLARFSLIYVAINIINDSRSALLWGVGTINVFDIFDEYKIMLNVYEQNNYPHNIFLFFILQFGVLALIPLLIYLGKKIFSSIRSIMSNFAEKKFLILPVSIIVGLIAQSVFEDKLLFPEYFIYPLFCFYLGFILKSLKNNLKESDIA